MISCHFLHYSKQNILDGDGIMQISLQVQIKHASSKANPSLLSTSQGFTCTSAVTINEEFQYRAKLC